jgi:hypothetical protein
MKEELNTLKNSVQQIAKGCESFKKQRNFFNMKAEEKFNETSTEEFFKEGCDSYDSAKILNECFSEIHSIVSQIKEEHPKYGNRRIKELVIKELSLQNEMLAYFESNLDVIIENYFIYESCGFFKLLNQEKGLEELGNEAKDATDAILDESKAAAIKAGKAAINVVKPYGEVAKSQLNDAGDAAKKVINKGSQKLKRFFENLEEKTKTK